MASLSEAKDIIKATPISSVVSFYHPISKRGANFEGICPFHGDNHPSLKINDDKGIYKCFACGAAGDSIKFVQDKLSIDFVSAIKDIASQLGIDVEEKKSQQSPKFDLALRALQAANKLYRKIANETSPSLFCEFIKQRKLNKESVQDFQLGFAPPNNVLVKYFQSIPNSERENAIAIAEDIGIIRQNKRGSGHYDFYRNRVIFPIWDHSGKVRGFSSRAILPDQVPKYLNSGESFIFDKGNTLYGFHLAKTSIRGQDSVIIVEGNMDVITLHQFGFTNSVATMGVSLSQSSIKLLSNMTKNIYLAMDSDPAGIKAMTKINADFLSEDITAKFINFSPAKDPDEFLNEFGRLDLQKRMDEAPSFIDYLIDQEIPPSIPESTEHKLTILKSIFTILSPIKSSLLANEKAIKAAAQLNLRSSHEDIIAEYKSHQNREGSLVTLQVSSQQSRPREALDFKESPRIDEYSRFSGPNQQIPQAERLVLETLISNPECILNDQISEILDKIQHYEVKRIVQWLKSIYLEIDETEFGLFVQEKMKEAIPEDIKSVMASAIFQGATVKLEKKVIDKTLTDLLKKIDEGLLKTHRNALREKQLAAITDEEGLLVMNEIQQIENKLLALRNK